MFKGPQSTLKSIQNLCTFKSPSWYFGHFPKFKDPLWSFLVLYDPLWFLVGPHFSCYVLDYRWQQSLQTFLWHTLYKNKIRDGRKHFNKHSYEQNGKQNVCIIYPILYCYSSELGKFRAFCMCLSTTFDTNHLLSFKTTFKTNHTLSLFSITLLCVSCLLSLSLWFSFILHHSTFPTFLSHTFLTTLYPSTISSHSHMFFYTPFLHFYLYKTP